MIKVTSSNHRNVCVFCRTELLLSILFLSPLGDDGKSVMKVSIVGAWMHNWIDNWTVRFVWEKNTSHWHVCVWLSGIMHEIAKPERRWLNTNNAIVLFVNCHNHKHILFSCKFDSSLPAFPRPSLPKNQHYKEG